MRYFVYIFYMLLSPVFLHAQVLDIIETDSLNKNERKIILADAINSEYVLNTNPLFRYHWDNYHLYVYDSIKFDALPDTLNFQLVNKESDFKFTCNNKLTSEFGKRWGRNHEGLDIPLHTGDTVVAAFDGVVRYAQFTSSGYGNCVIIRHFNGLETLYGHLSKILVLPNELIKSGNIIGLGGSTGRASGPHLHFETRYKDFPFDPRLIINFNTLSLENTAINIPKKILFAQRFEKIIHRNTKAKHTSKKKKNNKKDAKSKNKKAKPVSKKTSIATVNKNKKKPISSSNSKKSKLKSNSHKTMKKRKK